MILHQFSNTTGYPLFNSIRTLYRVCIRSHKFKGKIPNKTALLKTPVTGGDPAYPHFYLTWLQIWDFSHPLWIENSQNDSQNLGKCCAYNDHLFVKDTNEHLDEVTHKAGSWGEEGESDSMLSTHGSRYIPSQHTDVFTNQETL